MAFPASPRDVVTELYISGTWVDISTSVLARDTITISRGRPNEASRPQSCKCGLTIDNTSGNFSPRNPTGQWYGTLGRNTPLRLGIRTVTDAFARTVSSGWGSADTGQAWTTGVGVGSVSASDWAVGSGVGTHSVAAATAYRLSYLATAQYRDVDVRVDVTLPVTDITGGQVEPANLALRGQSTTDYLMVRLVVTTAEAVTIALHHPDGTVLAAAVTVAGLTHSSSQALRVRAQCEGQTLRAKVWPASGSEPYGWHVTAHSTRITGAGWIGVRSGVAAGNTNTKPVIFSYDNFVVTIPRFSGEVSTWPQRWDLSGNDRYVPIQVDGIMRRLGQGNSPLSSALKRGVLSDAIATPVAYWPCEEGGAAAGRMANMISGEGMKVYGSPNFGSNSDFACSDSLPTFNASVWDGAIPAHTLSGRCQVRMLVSVPAAGVGADRILCAVGLSGTIRTILIGINAAGALALIAYAPTGAVLYNSGFVAYAVNGTPLQMSIEFEQVGADVQFQLVTLLPGATSGSQLPGTPTAAGQTCGIARYAKGNPVAELTDIAAGHISVHNVWSSLFNLGDQLNAFTGEKAGDRIERLCAEEGIPFSSVGDLADTMAMGPQRPGALLDLLNEAADSDLGTLYEPRAEVGLSYRTRTSLYNQPATLALDYSSAQVTDLQPVDDDDAIRNDVTVKRVDGSSARAVLETGPLSVLPPDQGGVGRYDTEVTLNVGSDDQLADIASWLLHLGTTDEARYPSITVDLTTPGVVAAALEPQVLALDIDDRLTAAHPPLGLPPDQISQLARGYAETINLFVHTITANCSPESPYQVIELDNTESRYDSDGSTLAEDLTTTETAVDVAISDGTLWTTSGAEMPFDIRVGGEVMTVTAISGASSPQTFTVTRSVNGVVKTHSTGAEVRLARPPILAL